MIIAWRYRWLSFVLAFAGAMLGLAAQYAAATPPIEILDPERGSLLRYPDFDILVVRVLAADPEAGSNGAPPKATLAIDEVIRGAPRGPKVEAVWEPPYFGPQDDPEGTLIAAWRAAPLRTPAAGARLIVFAIDRSGVYSVQAHQVYAFSEANLATARQNAVHRRSDTIQFGLMVAVPGVVLLGLLPFVLSWLPGFSGQARRRHNLAVLAACVAAMALYVAYETGVPPYSAIRVDLLILAPALALALLLALVSLVRLLWRRKPR